ncbi:MAG TPA: pentapeptide repeat-containing protein [Candidatus Saccharimonadales bacterium]|jgi:uncharacterized protein YjbI with pentapeptide repeats
MKIALPQLPKDLPDAADLQKLLKSDETIASVSLSHENVSNANIRGVQAEEIRLAHIDATQAVLERMVLSDCEILACDLIATQMAEAAWRRVLVQGSRCCGIQLQSSSLKDVTFIDCKLNLANFRFCKLTNVRFQNCVLEEADFYAAEMTDVVFEHCKLDKTAFSSAKLKRVDFRTSDITGVRNIQGLAGATIDSTQLMAIAPLLATELKIVVKDDM